MTAFRILLIVIFSVIVVYTAIVVADHGLGLFPIFFGDIATMGWPGQFNMDFMGFLTLSGLWLAWRHHFSAGRNRIGVARFCWRCSGTHRVSSFRHFLGRGDIREVLLGKTRARG